MIKKTKVDGKSATVAYLRSNMEPVDSEEDAEMIKVVFDNGDVAFVVPSKEDDTNDE